MPQFRTSKVLFYRVSNINNKFRFGSQILYFVSILLELLSCFVSSRQCECLTVLHLVVRHQLEYSDSWLSKHLDNDFTICFTVHRFHLCCISYFKLSKLALLIPISKILSQRIGFSIAQYYSLQPQRP